jgi:hypothetical protein
VVLGVVLGYVGGMPTPAHCEHPGHPRDRRLAFRLSGVEYDRLQARAERAGARSASELVRSAALDGRFDLPMQRRELITAITELAGAISASPPGPIRDQALERAIALSDKTVSR